MAARIVYHARRAGILLAVAIAALPAVLSLRLPNATASRAPSASSACPAAAAASRRSSERSSTTSASCRSSASRSGSSGPSSTIRSARSALFALLFLAVMVGAAARGPLGARAAGTGAGRLRGGDPEPRLRSAHQPRRGDGARGARRRAGRVPRLAGALHAARRRRRRRAQRAHHAPPHADLPVRHDDRARVHRRPRSPSGSVSAGARARSGISALFGVLNAVLLGRLRRLPPAARRAHDGRHVAADAHRVRRSQPAAAQAAESRGARHLRAHDRDRESRRGGVQRDRRERAARARRRRTTTTSASSRSRSTSWRTRAAGAIRTTS